MNPIQIIEKYYLKESPLYRILVDHSQLVAEKALEIARKHPELGADTAFLAQAAMLHDIGIFKTHAPEIACTGDQPYIRHGIIGSELMRLEGYPLHALVCERHTGTGLSREMIESENLPLPLRDLMPLSIEEQIICFADKFYSKSHPGKEKQADQIRKSLLKYGAETANRFDRWCELFLP